MDKHVNTNSNDVFGKSKFVPDCVLVQRAGAQKIARDRTALQLSDIVRIRLDPSFNRSVAICTIHKCHSARLKPLVRRTLLQVGWKAISELELVAGVS
jgi:hypothetical protein